MVSGPRASLRSVSTCRAPQVQKEKPTISETTRKIKASAEEPPSEWQHSNSIISIYAPLNKDPMWKHRQHPGTQWCWGVDWWLVWLDPSVILAPHLNSCNTDYQNTFSFCNGTITQIPLIKVIEFAQDEPFHCRDEIRFGLRATENRQLEGEETVRSVTYVRIAVWKHSVIRRQ